MKLFGTKKLNTFLILLIIFNTYSCGRESETPVSERSKTDTCTTQKALISLSDGFSSAICGCGSSSVQTVSIEQSLSCQVTTGAQVFLSLQNQSVSIQMIPEQSGFSSSPVFTPTSPGAKSFVYLFSSAGTYSFYDIFQTNRKIIVTVSP